MKKAFAFLFSISFICSLFATPIQEKTALMVASNFYNSSFGNKKKSGINFTLAYKCTSTQKSKQKSANETVYYYVYNTGKEGFIIVSGDDASLPILGYSDEITFKPDNIPSTVSEWLDGYRMQIQYIADNNLEGDTNIKLAWDNLLTGNSILKSSLTEVAPLVKTKWDQSPYYNDLCPYDDSYNDRTVTGCVATAMAQLMKFWNYPNKGIGFHSYQHDTYGTLSANFSNTNYNWDNMPLTVTSKNTDVATLMYHCGVSIEMNYNVGELGGSGANTLDVANALKENFGYDSTVQGVSRKNYTDNKWLGLLKTELDNGRPVQYAGTGTGGGHSFVCDGYNSDDFFHFNWGWSGQDDGYFNINALNPGTLGTGGGTGGFNTNQRAIIGIKPPSIIEQGYELEIYSDVVSDKSSVAYGEPFTISTDITNNGTGIFNGDFCAAAFDENDVFVDYIETISNSDLDAGYFNTFTFATDGLLTLLPGKYNIYIFFRPKDGDWVTLNANKSDLSTIDYTSITVTNSNEIQLYSTFEMFPNDMIYSGKEFSVIVDVANLSTEDFSGSIDASLYTFDGDLVATVEEKSGLTLSKNSHYTNGLTFTTNNLDAEPGSYLLAIEHKKDGLDWELTGSTEEYANPIKIIVQGAPEEADVYENNDELANAYAFDVTFDNDNAIVGTIGSNIHVGTDYDYYKFSLDENYDYTLTPSLSDAFSSTDYTVDALFSYSTDGENWSDAYDDVLPEDITLSGENSIYFWVSPYFTGETGTYELDVAFSRTNSTSIKDNLINQEKINMYPLPADNYINIDLANSGKTIKQVNILNLTGATMSSNTNFNSKNIRISLDGFKSGIYLLELIDGSGNRKTGKLCIQK